jgi:hypothetical protein
LTADQIRALARRGEIGGHTVTHADLGRLGAAGQREEIAANKRFLEAIIGRPIRSFAYPYGSFSPDTAPILRELGYDGAVVAGRIAPGAVADPYHLPRIAVLGTWRLAELAAVVRRASGEDSRARSASDPQLLPLNRVVAYYGHPRSRGLGILGEHDRGTLLARLREQAAQYAAADPSRAVLPALELIAVVAQKDAGADGLYRARTSAEILNDYADFTAAHGLQLILDVQPGRATLSDEIDALLPWLRLPHVHLALDPEWAMRRDEIPGAVVGALDAVAISRAQAVLAKLVAERRLPDKLLIVHQFRPGMIRDKARLRRRAGVQLVIDADGFGDPHGKSDAYGVLVRDQPVEFGGFKLFYRQDHPLMTPRQVLSLTPAPDVVIYQ